MTTTNIKSSLIDAHFHPTHHIPTGYKGAACGKPVIHSEGVLWGVGLHPWDVQRNSKFIGAEQCSFVGEIGLDFMPKYKENTKAQIDVLNDALRYAQQNNKSVVLHCVRAHQELIKILKQFQDIRIYLHGFIGSTQLIEQYLKSHPNMFFGFTHQVTQSNKTISAFINLDIARILIETDNKANYDNLLLNYNTLSNIKDIKMDDLADQMKLNFSNWISK
jgi:TatD DNase family protein